MKRNDLTGFTFGKLTVLKMKYGEFKYGRKRTVCECSCACGKIVDVVADRLTTGVKTSCGCDSSKRSSESQRVDITGREFGRLIVEEMLWGEHGTPTKVACRCSCGNTTVVLAADLKNGHTKSCGCFRNEQTTAANTKDWTGHVSKYGVKLISKAVKKNGVWFWNCECGECGANFLALPAKIISGHTTSCGCRTRSSMESFMAKYLKDRKVDYIEQYRFEDCFYKYTLPFDIAIMDGSSPTVLIEYDGKQHYYPVDFFGGEESFEHTKNRDKIKDDYCKRNNIPLVRIPYTCTEEEVENILSNIIYP